jgi:hypothetical protein
MTPSDDRNSSRTDEAAVPNVTDATCPRCLGHGSLPYQDALHPFVDDDVDERELAIILLVAANAVCIALAWFIMAWPGIAFASCAMLVVDLAAAAVWHRTYPKSRKLPNRHSATRRVSRQRTPPQLRSGETTKRNTVEEYGSRLEAPVTDTRAIISERRTTDLTVPSPVVMDVARLEQLRGETLELQRLLAPQFVNNLTVEKAADQVLEIPRQDELMATIPQDYVSFAQALFGQATWSQEQYTALARTHGVMPGAAMETLNDAAQSMCGDLWLSEDKGAIVLNSDLFGSQDRSS